MAHFFAFSGGSLQGLGRSVRCALGKGGVKAAGEKREGDGASPIGIWPGPVRMFERMPGGALVGLSESMAVILETDGRLSPLQLPDGGGSLVSAFRSAGEVVFGYRDRGIIMMV